MDTNLKEKFEQIMSEVLSETHSSIPTFKFMEAAYQLGKSENEAIIKALSENTESMGETNKQLAKRLLAIQKIVTNNKSSKSVMLDDIHVVLNPTKESLLASVGDGWISISDYPQDGPVVQRWHKIYKCIVSVYFKPNASTVQGCDWVTGTLDHTWPELAFEPFFKPLPQPPQQ